HRGITHSIPFTILWPILITFLIFTFFSGTNPFHVWMWAQLAVFLQVFVDIFNSYGTQELRPITNKWIQFSVTNKFAPILFTVHCIGLVLWVTGFHLFAVLFPIIAFPIIYYTTRFKMRSVIKQQALKANQQEHHPVKVFVAPTIKFMEWRVAIQTDAHDYVG
ncbi:metal-dependent hydrolase, partial [Staphylococcus aureus]|uniref:metal-dependent hydrolase n=1 Tax=Staphylococcus aureus TaxID=1280 RepID=UPI000AE94163